MIRLDWHRSVVVFTFPLPRPARLVLRKLRALWIWATYWRVACKDCKGTGLCHQTPDGAPARTPHSCCGDCGRREVPAAQVPPGFKGAVLDGKVKIGDGVMYCRPWSRTQTRLP